MQTQISCMLVVLVTNDEKVKSSQKDTNSEQQIEYNALNFIQQQWPFVLFTTTSEDAGLQLKRSCKGRSLTHRLVLLHTFFRNMLKVLSSYLQDSMVAEKGSSASATLNKFSWLTFCNTCHIVFRITCMEDFPLYLVTLSRKEEDALFAGFSNWKKASDVCFKWSSW